MPSTLVCMATNIGRLIFNSFGVNTYILSDNTGKCLIVDPACSTNAEESRLAAYITENHLQPVGMVNTHFHIDHILGNTFTCNSYNIKPQCHIKSKLLWETAAQCGLAFGLKIDNMIIPADFIKEDKGVVTYSFEVTWLEYLGAERLVYGNVGEKSHARHVVSRLPGNVSIPIEAGRTYPFAVSRSDLRFFDRENGLRTDQCPL